MLSTEIVHFEVFIEPQVFHIEGSDLRGSGKVEDVWLTLID